MTYKSWKNLIILPIHLCSGKWRWNILIFVFLEIFILKQKIFYTKKFCCYSNPLLLGGGLRERPKRTVNIFLAGYFRWSWFYDFMSSILWSCRLDSRYRFLRSFRFLYWKRRKRISAGACISRWFYDGFIARVNFSRNRLVLRTCSRKINI